MRLTVCGSAGSYGSPGRACSSYLLQSDEANVVLDCGNGSFSNLSTVIDPGKIDAVLISHSHHDHVVDLASFFHFLRFVPSAFRRKIKLIASASTLSSFDTIFALEFESVFDLVTVNPQSLTTLGDFHMTFFDTSHMDGSLAIRIVGLDGNCVVYTGDAGPSSELAHFSHGANLLIGECTWIHRPARVGSGLHHDAFELGELAKLANVDSVMVTHVAYPGDPIDASALVKGHFGGNVITAIDNLSIQL